MEYQLTLLTLTGVSEKLYSIIVNAKEALMTFIGILIQMELSPRLEEASLRLTLLLQEDTPAQYKHIHQVGDLPTAIIVSP